MTFYESLDIQTTDDKLTAVLRGCGHFLFLQNNHGATQDSVICILKKEGPLPQKAVAEKLNIKPASASELVTKLEKKGILERKRAEDDKRKVLLYLTEKGKRIPEMKETEKSHIYDALSEEEKETLLPLLVKLMRSWVKEEEK